MNFRDSEVVTGLLLDSGFTLAGSVEDADVALFNSCSVRKHAEDRLISNISDLNILKKKRPGLVIGLIGCTAQNYKKDILEKLPILDIVCGPGNESDLPAMIRDVLKDRGQLVAVDKVDDKRPEIFPRYRSDRFRAYVSISEGCNNYCSYCIVPYVRGRERSREARDIIREVKDLAERGFREITLLGQNVNSYRGLADSVERIAYSKKLSAIRYPLSAKTSDFIQLLEQLNAIKGIERIRFMTSHPKDASSALFEAMRDLDKVCEHLHLPLQSGSDRVLKAMNRKYTAKKYLGLIDEYKKIVPGGSITTDIIVGFPSETAADFNKTVGLMKKILFDAAFMFKYSPRPPAKSSQMKDDVPGEVKQRRLEAILNLQCNISLKKNNEMIDKTTEVLVDAMNPKSPKFLTGRTRSNKVTVFKGDKRLIGRLANVKIDSASPHALKGKLA
jgi:tRNA-2-methylthio-N6-dimethylallyladenosine synthase